MQNCGFLARVLIRKGAILFQIVLCLCGVVYFHLWYTDGVLYPLLRQHPKWRCMFVIVNQNTCTEGIRNADITTTECSKAAFRK